jgi:hypothetical protein
MAIPSLLGALWEALSAVFTSLLTNLGVWFQPVTQWFTNAWQNFVNIVQNVWNSIKNAVSNAINAVKNTISNIWTGIKNTTSNIWNGIKSGVSNAANAIKNTVSNIFNSVKTTVSNIWNGIKTAISTPINAARDLVQGAIDAIKGFFDFDISWPKIPMPHFSISPSGWEIGDLLKGSIPKLGIEWYAKGGIMTKPTLFDYNPVTGTAKVGGEAGDEAVAPISVLQDYVRAAVAEQNAGVNQLLERIVELLVQFFPDALDAMRTPMLCDTNGLAIAMAPAMNTELGKIAIKKGRGR